MMDLARPEKEIDLMSEREREERAEEARRKLALFFVPAMSAPPAVYCQYVAIFFLSLLPLSVFTLYTCSPWTPLVIEHWRKGDGRWERWRRLVGV